MKQYKVELFSGETFYVNTTSVMKALDIAREELCASEDQIKRIELDAVPTAEFLDFEEKHK